MKKVSMKISVKTILRTALINSSILLLLIVGVSNSSAEDTEPVPLATPPTNHLTELFEDNDLYLENTTLTFTPDASQNFYKLSLQAAKRFPSDPTGGESHQLNDDAFVKIPLSLSFYGIDYTRFFVGSNGYITFSEGDDQTTGSLEHHFSQPRISALFVDLDPNSGGTVSSKQFDDRVAITFENIPEYSMDPSDLNSNSFQIELFFNGVITITYLGVDAENAVVGLSQGLGIPDNFVESNLSEDFSFDFFTEDFEHDDFDLEFTSLTFTPNRSPNRFRMCKQPTSKLPSEPSQSTLLEFVDSDVEEIAILDDKEFPYFGEVYSYIYVNKTGSIAFKRDEVDDVPSLSYHFSVPRISHLLFGIEPDSDGDIRYAQLENRIVITYKDISPIDAEQSNNFQFILYFDGTITLTTLNTDLTNGVVGLSCGLGVPETFQEIESDLSASDPCIFDLGHVVVDSFIYACGSTMNIEVWDRNAGTGPLSVSLNTTKGDQESIEVSDRDGNKMYTGTIKIGSFTDGFRVGDGTLQSHIEDTVAVSYVDQNAGSGEGVEERKIEAKIDCQKPELTNSSSVKIGYESFEVKFETTELATGTVRVGTECDNYEVERSSELAAAHSIGIPNLRECSFYYYTIELKDKAGNVSVVNNGDTCFKVNTLRVGDPVFSDDFEGADQGWTGTGLWHQIDDSSQHHQAHSGVSSWWYGSEDTGDYDQPPGQANQGYLKSPEIEIPDGPDSFLTFKSLSQTEGNFIAYDVMTVYVNTGSERDTLHQIRMDSSTWIEVGPIDLSDYKGQKVQIEFEFSTGDGLDNDFWGWFLDDITVATQEDCMANTGFVKLSQGTFSCGDRVELDVWDLNGPDGSGVVKVSTDGGDSESVEAVDPDGDKVYNASIPISPPGEAVSANDGTIQGAVMDKITVEYSDADDGSGNPTQAKADAILDCGPPQISNTSVSHTGLDTFTVTFETTKPAAASVRAGPECGNLTTEKKSDFGISHSVTFSGLDPCTPYFYSVRVINESSESATENEDPCHRVITHRPDAYFWDNFEREQKGWLADGQWHRVGELDNFPQAKSGKGSWWYGSEESGDFYAPTSETNKGTLLSPEISLPSDSSVSLSFNSWLHISRSSDFAKVFVVKTDGSKEPIFTGTKANSSWEAIGPIDLSPFSGETIQIAFEFDTNDEFHSGFRGWYIDDVTIGDLESIESIDCIEDLGSVVLNKSTFACGEAASIEIWDSNVSSTSLVFEVRTDAGDVEQLEAFDSFGAEIYRGSIQIASAGDNVKTGDGIIQGLSEDMITVVYTDSDTGAGEMDTVELSTPLDCDPPQISEVTIEEIGIHHVTVSFQTNEPAQTTVYAGLNCFKGTFVQTNRFRTTHNIVISRLDPCTRYFLSIEATDRVGNRTSDGGSRYCESFVTQTDDAIVFADDFEGETNGWTSTGLWHKIDGTSNYQKANSGLGSWWFGSELTGNYDDPPGKNVLGELLSPSITLPDADSISLSYYSWLDGDGELDFFELFVVQDDSYYHLFTHSNSTGSWEQIDHVDLNAFSGETIQLKFLVEADNLNNDFRGWYIDDLVIRTGRTCLDGRGDIFFTRESFGCGQTFEFSIHDSNVDAENIVATITTAESGDMETVTLVDDNNDHFYHGSMPVNTLESTTIENDSILQGGPTDTIRVVYQDADAGNSDIVEVVKDVPLDCDPPDIQVSPEVVPILWGTPFPDLSHGVTISDNVDQDLIDKLVVGGDRIDTNTIGTYTVTYTILDRAGNPSVAEASRIYEVIDNLRLVIEPEHHLVNAEDHFDIAVKVESASQTVDHVQVFLKFNPSIFAATHIAPNSIFPNVIESEVDNNDGLIRFIAKSESKHPLGSFNVFTVEFTALASPPSYCQAIDFRIDADRLTDVRFNDESILHFKEPATICVELPERVWVVDQNAVNSFQTGRSWLNAFKYLEDALEEAEEDDEIWVAAGEYTPGIDSEDTFQLRDGVNLYGGFDGTEVRRTDRNWALNQSILSSNDIESGKFNANYHIVTGADNAILDGFTISLGEASPLFGVDGEDDTRGFGGGLYNDNSSPLIRNCIFSWNRAINGGAVYNANESSPILENCIFIENEADNGGAIYNTTDSSVTLRECIFFANNARQFDGSGGGGISNVNNSDLEAENCIFFGNFSEFGGAGISNISSRVSITNCTFIFNFAYERGVGLFHDGPSSDAVVKNCIFWNETGLESNKEIWGEVNATYSCIRGGYEGESNIADNPNFVDETGGILYLKPNSPCIDSGTTDGAPGLDFRGKPRHLGDGVDMGAFEVTGSPVVYALPIHVLEGEGKARISVKLLRNNDQTVSVDYVAQNGSAEAGTDFVASSGSLFWSGTESEDKTIVIELAVDGIRESIEDIILQFSSEEAEVIGLLNYDLLQISNSINVDVVRPTALVTIFSHDIIYVNANKLEPGDGTSWATAYRNLADALKSDVADESDEIWVAAGTYNPGSDRQDAFEMEFGVSLYAGFSGTELNRDDRDWMANVTVLSGDVRRDNGPNFANYDDNNYNVVRVYDVGIGTSPGTLDGFVITGGNASGSFFTNERGGGIYNESARFKISNCIIFGNNAEKGGGLYNASNSTTIENCILYTNNAKEGGGIYDESFATIIKNCILKNNHAVKGGGIYTDSPDQIIVNSTVVDNVAPSGGAMNILQSPPKITNSIFWNNSSNMFAFESPDVENPTIDITYSCVQGGYPGTNNIESDPLVTYLGFLTSESPCIDAGVTASDEPQTDWEGEARFDHPDHQNVTSLVDIGADEFIDEDLDGLADSFERRFFGGSEPFESLDDSDNDNLTNLQEYQLSSNPLNPDTDLDGRWDGDEIIWNSESETFDKISDPLYPDTPVSPYTFHTNFINTTIGDIEPVFDSIVADFDQDKDLDLAVSTRDKRLLYFENRGTPVISSWKVFDPLQQTGERLAAGDLDGDKDIDILHYTSQEFSLIKYRGDEDPEQLPWSQESERFELDIDINDISHSQIRLLDIVNSSGDSAADGFDDMIFLDSHRQMTLIPNLSSGENLNWGSPIRNWAGNAIFTPRPNNLYDIDLDGDLDFFRGIDDTGAPQFEINPDEHLLLFPRYLTIVEDNSQSIVVAGDHGNVQFSLVQNESGGSITESGFYTAGRDAVGVDVIRGVSEGGLSGLVVVNVISSQQADRKAKVLIVVGTRSLEDSLFSTSERLAMDAYVVCRQRGYRASDICLLTPNGTLSKSIHLGFPIDAEDNNGQLETTIKDWAHDADDVILYFVDHGVVREGKGNLVLRPGGYLTSETLKMWLDDWQTQKEERTSLVIIDTCYSGHFVEELAFGSPQRIVMAASGPGALAHFQGNGSISFSQLFWDEIAAGAATHEAFLATVDNLADTLDQVPLIDTDGDGLPENPEGLGELRDIGLADLVGGVQRPAIGIVMEDININESSTTLWCRDVVSNNGIQKVIAYIVPPTLQTEVEDRSALTDMENIELVDYIARLWIAKDDFERWQKLPEKSSDPNQPVLGAQDKELLLSSYTEIEGIYVLNDDVPASDLQRLRTIEERLGYPPRYEADWEEFDTPGLYRVLFFAEDNWGMLSTVRSAQITIEGPGKKAMIIECHGITDVGTPWSSDEIGKQAQLVRQTLHNRSFTAEDIQWFGPAHQAVNKATIADVLISDFVEDIDELTLYWVGNATTEGVLLSDDDMLTPLELKGWLDILQGNSTCRVTVVVETDYSGRFLAGVANPDYERYVVTSTDSVNQTLRSSGLTFGNWFWGEIRRGRSIQQAFTRSKAIARASQIQPIPFSLDDDGNGTYEKKDGLRTSNKFIGTLFLTGDDEVQIGSVSESLVLEPGDSGFLFVKDAFSPDGAELRVTATLIQAATGEIMTDDVLIMANAGSGHYQRDIHYDDFPEPGRYVAIIQVASLNDSTLSAIPVPVDIFVGIAPPENNGVVEDTYPRLVVDDDATAAELDDSGQDIYRLWAVVSQAITIELENVSEGADVRLAILAGPQETDTPLEEADDAPAGSGELIFSWNPLDTGWYYVQVEAITVNEVPISYSIGATSEHFGADGYEEDDIPEMAKWISWQDGDFQEHNFHDEGDEDWLFYYALKKPSYEIKVSEEGVNCDVILELYKEVDGDFSLLQNVDQTQGNGEIMSQTGDQTPGRYYVRIRNANPQVHGVGTGYRIEINDTSGFIPGILMVLIHDNFLNEQLLTGTVSAAGLDPFNEEDKIYILDKVPAGTHEVTVSVTGYQPNPVSKSVDVQANDLTEAHFNLTPISLSDRTVSLKKGWNMTSLPFIPRDNRVETVFQDCVLSGEVWSWKDGRLQLAPRLKPMTGYWVYCHAQQEPLSIQGMDVVDTTKTLSKGWNLFGAAANTPLPETIEGPIWYWDDGIFKKAQTLKAGRGYWMYTDEPVTIDFDTAPETD